MFFSFDRHGIKLKIVFLLTGSLMPSADAIVCVFRGVARHIEAIVSKARNLVHVISCSVLSLEVAGSAEKKLENSFLISTDCPFRPREILQDGKYGKLAPVGNPQFMAKSISETCDAPFVAKDLKKRAEFFSPDTATGAYLNIFNNLCRNL